MSSTSSPAPRRVCEVGVEADAESPSLGRERPGIHPGYRNFPSRSHLVFYVEDGDFINIIGIPHKSMDVGALFL